MQAVRAVIGVFVVAVVMLFLACAAISELLEPRRKTTQAQELKW